MVDFMIDHLRVCARELKLHIESTTTLLQCFGNLPQGNRCFVGFSSALAYTFIAAVNRPYGRFVDLVISNIEKRISAYFVAKRALLSQLFTRELLMICTRKDLQDLFWLKKL